MARSEWIGSVKRAGFAAVAAVIGNMTARGRGWGPCPACGGKARGAEDGRAPISTGDGVGWRCHACSAHGDPVDLLSYAVAGRRLDECGPTEMDAVRERAEGGGLVRPDDRSSPGGVTRPGAAGPVRSGRPGRAVGVQAPAAGPTMRVGRPGRAAEAVDVVPSEAEVVGPGGVREDRRWLGSVWSPGLADACVEALWSSDAAEPVRRYLTGGLGGGPGGSNGRRLPEASIRKWRLGAFIAPDGSAWVSIPLLDPRSGEFINCKFCRVPLADGTRPKPKYLACPGRPLPLFGARALSNDLGAPVVLVEGELDVVALHAYGWEHNVVSGTSGAGSFDDDWLDALEPYQTFVLLYDDDEKGDEGAEALSEKLGKDRCARARLPLKDAGECWATSVETDVVERAIERGKPLSGMEIRRAGSYIESLERRIAGGTQSLMGISTGSARMDQLVAGWSRGLNVVTADSGVGKTTFCTWSVREAARMGVPTIITSFEQGQDGSFEKLLRMELGGNYLDFTMADRAAAAANIDRMPLWILDRYGRATVPDLVASIKYHRRRNGVKLWLVDHMGFLVDSSKDDERRQIDHLIRELTITGYDDDVAIVLIAHPDKGKREGRRVHIHDLKGSSAIEQDAAAGIVLSRDHKVKQPHTVINVDKLRKEWGAGSGSSGIVYFDPRALLFADKFDDLPFAAVWNAEQAERDRERAAREAKKRQMAAESEQPDGATRAAGG